jgi:osmotically-inducible protein OsmY
MSVPIGQDDEMGRMRSLLRLSGPAIAAFAWRNRDELLELAAFGVRAVQAALPGDASFDDVKTEARLRYALMNDKRTRRADGLHVEVFDGVALLHGVVEPDVEEIATLIAEGVPGVRRVDNRLRVTKRGWRPWRTARAEPASTAGELKPGR